jgi:hypothetical protein
MVDHCTVPVTLDQIIGMDYKVQNKWFVQKYRNASDAGENSQILTLFYSVTSLIVNRVGILASVNYVCGINKPHEGN